MSKKNWDRAAWFLLGTFLGGWVLGLLSSVIGRVTK